MAFTERFSGDNFDWFASFDKHPQTLVFFARPRGPCQCCYFPFAFIQNRELPSEIRRAWARALTADTVRARSAAMSKSGASL